MTRKYDPECFIGYYEFGHTLLCHLSPTYMFYKQDSGSLALTKLNVNTTDKQSSLFFPMHVLFMLCRYAQCHYSECRSAETNDLA
jgi:hypothetical protein